MRRSSVSRPSRVRWATASGPPASPQTEARDLAFLLRGGALTAPISIANEKTITGTLGKENIEKGVKALVIGMAALFAFMIIYYRLFGVVANLVLLANVDRAHRIAVDVRHSRSPCRASPASSSPSAWRWTRTC